MSVDKFYLVKADNTAEPITYEEALDRTEDGRAHTIYVVNSSGVEDLFLYQDGQQAAEAFEKMRRQPCERIVLTLDGVEQPQRVGRLPVDSQPGTGCGVDISWNGEYPEYPAEWGVRCGQPVAGEVEDRPACKEHLDARQRILDARSVSEKA